MARYERSKKGSHVDTVHYEIDMLEYALAKLTTETEVSRPELNVTLECSVTVLGEHRNVQSTLNTAYSGRVTLARMKPEMMLPAR